MGIDVAAQLPQLSCAFLKPLEWINLEGNLQTSPLLFLFANLVFLWLLLKYRSVLLQSQSCRLILAGASSGVRACLSLELSEPKVPLDATQPLFNVHLHLLPKESCALSPSIHQCCRAIAFFPAKHKYYCSPNLLALYNPMAAASVQSVAR